MSPRSGPGGPRSAPRGAKTAPGAAPEPLQRPPASFREQDRRPEASREPFWSHFGSIFDPPGHNFQWCSLASAFNFRVRSCLFSPAPSALLVAFSVLQALRPPLGGRFWGASPSEIRPPSITKRACPCERSVPGRRTRGCGFPFTSHTVKT